MFQKSDRFIANPPRACVIPLIYKVLSGLVLVLQLAGCKATYDLGVYEQSLLALGGPDGVNQSAALLDQSIVSAEMVSAIIPPGVYADHGILLHMAGNTGAMPADMSAAGPSYLHKLTGADAILSVTITEWEPTWMIIPLIHVAAEYKLVDIATGQDIWKNSARDEFDPTVTGGGGPVVVMDKDLRVPARRLTAKALKSSENGLPYGPYH